MKQLKAAARIESNGGEMKLSVFVRRLLRWAVARYREAGSFAELTQKGNHKR